MVELIQLNNLVFCVKFTPLVMPDMPAPAP